MHERRHRIGWWVLVLILTAGLRLQAGGAIPSAPGLAPPDRARAATSQSVSATMSPVALVRPLSESAAGIRPGYELRINDSRSCVFLQVAEHRPARKPLPDLCAQPITADDGPGVGRFPSTR